MAPNRRSLPAFRLYFASCSLAASLAVPCLAHAENGAIAYARPASDIVIDGDLSDWPQTAERYAIAETLGSETWRDPAYFRVAYAPTGDALYIALVVEDASAVSGEPGAANWLAQDSHLVYVDAHHSPRGSVGWLFAATDAGHTNLSNPLSWDPAAARASDDSAEMAVARQGGQLIYEWRIALDRPVRAGMSLGLDHLLVDIDAGEDASARALSTWGPFGAKSQRASRMGDLILLSDDDQLGTLSGAMSWADGVPGGDMAGLRVRVISAVDPELWVVVAADDNGRYSVDLPPGEYCAKPTFLLYGPVAEFRIAEGVQACADVVAGDETTAPDLIWRTRPRPEALIGESGLLFEFDDETAEQLDAFMAAYMDHFTIPGAGVAIIREGEVVYRQEYGVSNWLTQEPVRSDDLFDVGSITKPVFGFAVMRLVEQGVLELDRPLHEYLPFEDIAHDERAQMFTARHVLSHQTGLPNWRWQNDDGELDIAFTPGQGYRYSGEGYDYLGRVIEHLTGEELETVLMREAVGPLGMDPSVRFSKRDDWHDRFVFGHSELRAFASQAPDEAHAAYSLHASASDLAQVLLTWMRRGGGLSEAGYDAMFEPQVDTEYTAPDTDWRNFHALGPRVLETPYGRAIGHGGLNWGQIAVMEFYEDHDAGFVLTTNGDDGMHVRNALRRFLVAGQEYSVVEED